MKDRMLAVREAAENRRAHFCSDSCPRNSDGYCFVRIGLWRAQHQAAMQWNAPPQDTSGNSYL